MSGNKGALISRPFALVGSDYIQNEKQAHSIYYDGRYLAGYPFSACRSLVSASTTQGKKYDGTHTTNICRGEASLVAAYR
jgi:hypothetical protein